jgi:hypothetical protein
MAEGDVRGDATGAGAIAVGSSRRVDDVPRPGSFELPGRAIADRPIPTQLPLV